MRDNNWVQELFGSIDGMNSTKFAAFLSEDAVFTFGNSPQVVGNNNIENAVEGFFQSLKAIKHHDLQCFDNGNVVIVRGNSTYTRKNDTTLTVGFCNVLELEKGLIKDYRIYIDLSQLYS